MVTATQAEETLPQGLEALPGLLSLTKCSGQCREAERPQGTGLGVHALEKWEWHARSTGTLSSVIAPDLPLIKQLPVPQGMQEHRPAHSATAPPCPPPARKAPSSRAASDWAGGATGGFSEKQG